MHRAMEDAGASAGEGDDAHQQGEDEHQFVERVEAQLDGQACGEADEEHGRNGQADGGER